MGDTDSALAGIKGRKTATNRGRTATGAPVPPVAATGPVRDAIQRKMPFLFDPAEMPPVIEMSGYVPDANLAEYYVIAEVDGHRTTTPDGCVTSVCVKTWSVGQRVRRDVYAAYLNENPELVPPEPAATPAVDPPAEVVT